MKRIDHLTPGTTVTLGFKHDEEAATFLGIKGTGAGRRAAFESTSPTGKTYRWEAYRYQGGWAYGSSADRLRLVAIDS